MPVDEPEITCTPPTSVIPASAAAVEPPPARLRVPPRAELDDGQRALHEAITGGPRAGGPALFALQDDDGRLLGPFGPMLLNPALGQALQGLGVQVRYGTALSDRVREFAVLVVAQSEDSAFERYAHEAVGRHVGLTDEQLAAVRSGTTPATASPDEAVAVATAAALCRSGDLDDAQWAAAEQQLGPQAVFELTTLVGYYRLLALLLRVHRIDAPPD